MVETVLSAAQRGVGRAGRPRLGVLLGLLAGLLLIIAVVCWLGRTPVGIDSSVYRAGALAVLRHLPLYGALPDAPRNLPFTYPPPAALFCLPLATVPAPLGWGLVGVLSVVSVGVIVHTTVAHTPSWARCRGWLVLAAFAVEPVWHTISFGQVNLILAALVIVDLYRLRGSRYGGVLIGIAAAIKLTPLIFVLHLFVIGRRRDALRASGTFLVLNACTTVLWPSSTATYWGSAVLAGDDATSNAWIGNQSLNGVLHRFFGSAPWVFAGVAALAVLGGLGVALIVRRLSVTGRHFPALLVTALYGTMISPIAWTHHWVWALPTLIVLVYRAKTAPIPFRLAVTLLIGVFVSCPITWLPAPLAGVSYPAAGLIAIALLAVRTGIAPRAEISVRAEIPARTGA